MGLSLEVLLLSVFLRSYILCRTILDSQGAGMEGYEEHGGSEGLVLQYQHHRDTLNRHVEEHDHIIELRAGVQVGAKPVVQLFGYIMNITLQHELPHFLHRLFPQLAPLSSQRFLPSSLFPRFSSLQLIFSPL